MELPAYHAPAWGSVLRATWERGFSFIKRAGTVILVSSVILWFLQGYGFVGGVLQPVEDNNHSLLAAVGSGLAWLFYPLGWAGEMAWKATVATLTGLIAKEEVVNTFGVLYQYAGEADLMEDSSPIWAAVAADRRRPNRKDKTAGDAGRIPCLLCAGRNFLSVFAFGGLQTRKGYAIISLVVICCYSSVGRAHPW